MKDDVITIVIPCRNEERYIEACLGDVLAFERLESGDYEVLVLDGCSTDRTPGIVAEIARSDPRVRLVRNPGRIAPTALNIGIREARGQWIMRLDAHARYPRDYLRKCHETAVATGADNVGGIRKTDQGGTLWTLAMAVMISHPFAAGNAVYRTGTRMTGPREVDTVFGGFFRRDVFKRIGLFDERLVRAQDREFNARLRREGGRIVLNPEIVCTYFPRTSLVTYLQWTYRGALWAVRAQRISGTRLLSWRNFVPAGFVAFQLAGVCAVGAMPAASACLAAGIAVYILAALTASVHAAAGHRRPLLALLLPPLFYVTHMAYGLGFIQGIVEWPFRKAAAGTMRIPEE